MQEFGAASSHCCFHAFECIWQPPIVSCLPAQMAEAGPMQEFDVWFKLAASCGMQVSCSRCCLVQQLLAPSSVWRGTAYLDGCLRYQQTYTDRLVSFNKARRCVLATPCADSCHVPAAVQEPNAMSLATATADGQPSVR